MSKIVMSKIAEKWTFKIHQYNFNCLWQKQQNNQQFYFTSLEFTSSIHQIKVQRYTHLSPISVG